MKFTMRITSPNYLMYSSISLSIFSHSFSTNLLNNLSLLEPLKIPPGKKTEH